MRKSLKNDIHLSHHALSNKQPNPLCEFSLKKWLEINGYCTDCSESVGGDGITYGGDVGGGNPNEVLYISPTGNLTSDSLFTRNASTTETIIASSVGAFSAGFTDRIALESNLVISPGQSLNGFNVTHSDNAGENSFLFIGDATAAGISSYASIIGYSNANTGQVSRVAFIPDIMLLSVSDGIDIIEVTAFPTNFNIGTTNIANAITILEDSATSVALRMGETGVSSFVQQYSDYAVGLVVPSYRDVLGLVTTASEINFYLASTRPTSPTTASTNFIGNGSAINLTSGVANSIWGFGAGIALSTGSSNTLIGTSAGLLISTGSDNTIIGASAGANAQSGITDMVFVGRRAGQNTNNSANQNVFVGVDSGRLNTTGSFNAFFGNQSGSIVTTGSGNAIYGYNAGSSLTTGEGNTFIGTNAGDAITTTGMNVIVGHSAGRDGSTSFTRATIVGYGAGQDNAANDNTFIGYGAGGAVTTGDHNVMIGARAGELFAAGMDNVVIGSESAINLVGGNSNVIIGNDAVQTTTAGSSNVFIGDDVSNLSSNVGSLNVIIGRAAALSITASNITAVGAEALQALQSGQRNVAFGYQAGNSLVIGQGNTFIGYDTDTSNSGASSSIALGAGATVTASNQFVVGGSTDFISTVYFGSGVTNASTNAVTISGTNASGSNVGASNLIIKPGSSTGNQVSPSLILQVSDVSITGGTTLQGGLTVFTATASSATGAFVSIGDPSEAKNKTKFVINDPNETIDFELDATLTIRDTAAGANRVAMINATNNRVQFGDLDGVANQGELDINDAVHTHYCDEFYIKATPSPGGSSVFNVFTGASPTIHFGDIGLIGNGEQFFLSTAAVFQNVMIHGDEGANATAASSMDLDERGNYYEVTGATTIDRMTDVGSIFAIGVRTIVVLRFGSSLTVKHNSAAATGYVPFLLAGSVDAVPTANSFMTFQLINGFWAEISRSFA